MQLPCQGEAQDLCLIKGAFSQTGCMQGDRNDPIGGVGAQMFPHRVCHPFPKEWGQRQPPLVFQGHDELFGYPFVMTGADCLKGRSPPSMATERSRAWELAVTSFAERGFCIPQRGFASCATDREEERFNAPEKFTDHRHSRHDTIAFLTLSTYLSRP